MECLLQVERFVINGLFVIDKKIKRRIKEVLPPEPKRYIEIEELEKYIYVPDHK